MSINYYVVGSTYYHTDRPGEDMFRHMVSQKVVSVGWAEDIDLTDLYDKPHQEIIDYLKSEGEGYKSYSSLKHFLSLKPGDMIAVKKWDGNGGIIVRAYARVVKRQGKIYRFHRSLLKHMINVDYIKKCLPPISFPFNYSQTIHHVTNPERIREIFGPVLAS